MKTIGILGGLGPESTMAYYSYITRKYYKTHADYAYPEIVIYSLKFSDFIDAGYKLPGRVKTAIEKLHRAGADFVVAACNSLHIVYEEVCKDIPVPWISITDATGEEIRSKGFQKVGLLGTVFTLRNDFYQRGLTKYGLETIVPDKQAQQEINRIIYGELVIGQVKDKSRGKVLEIIDELGENGAEGVVLGCTELPFLIKAEHVDLPIFDTVEIHAQKALDLALEEGPLVGN